jgi:hypothetical protein
MSARTSTLCASAACSGGMYDGVPIETLSCVVWSSSYHLFSAAGSSVLAVPFVFLHPGTFTSPRSATFTMPWMFSIRFSGFTSRCTIPCSCAKRSPRAA